MKRIAVLVVICTTIHAWGLEMPRISNVTLQQQKHGRKVFITYQIDQPGIATFQFTTGGVALAHNDLVKSVKGAVNDYRAAGTHSFEWNAGLDYPEETRIEDFAVEMKLWPADNPPLFCAVNLAQNPSPTRWYASEEEMPHPVNHPHWKKEWLLLRKIPPTAGRSEALGSPPSELGYKPVGALRSIRITKPFYLGVFQVTQRQWELVAGNRPSVFTHPDYWEMRPVEQVSYNNIRCKKFSSNTTTDVFNWPRDGHTVYHESFLGLLRTRVADMLEFDLPTSAQWEHACRAGTTTAWNNGLDLKSTSDDSVLSTLGRYQRNGGYVNGTTDVKDSGIPYLQLTDEYGTATVGTYPPNAWGLYDMHGNVWEWCLDWADANPATDLGDDPTGPEIITDGANTTRVMRGGSWNQTAGNCRSSAMLLYDQARNTRPLGLRLCAPALALGTPAE